MAPGLVNLFLFSKDIRKVHKLYVDMDGLKIRADGNVGVSQCKETGVVSFFLPDTFRDAVQGTFHRGWRMTGDGVLHLLLSKVDATMLTLQECKEPLVGKSGHWIWIWRVSTSSLPPWVIHT